MSLLALHAMAFLLLLGVPSLPSNPCSTGAADFQSGYYSIAQKILWECIEGADPDPQRVLDLSLTYSALKNFSDGRARVDKAIESHPASAEVRYLSAYLYFKDQQYKRSIDELSVAYRNNPADWRLHHLYALNLIELQQMPNAEQELLRALKLKPEDAEMYYQLARLYYTENRFPDSIDASKHALHFAPEYAEVYDNLGLSYQALGDLPRAIDSYSKAINLGTRHKILDAWPYINYASLLAERSPSAAISLLRQSIAIDPKNAEANYQLGRALRLASKPQEAQPCFERAIALDPKLASAYYALSNMLRTSDPARSAKLLQEFQALRKKEASSAGVNQSALSKLQ